MLGKRLLSVMFELVSVLYGLQVRHFIFRGSCRNVAVWKRHTVDAKLNVQPIKEAIAKTEEVCSHECLKHDQCVSYNYHPANNQCELLDTHQFAEQATFMQSKGWTYADATKSGEFNYFEGKCSGEQHEEMDLYGCWPTCDGGREYHYEHMYPMLEALNIDKEGLDSSSGDPKKSFLQLISSSDDPWVPDEIDSPQWLGVQFDEEVNIAAVLIRTKSHCFLSEFSISYLDGMFPTPIVDGGENDVFQINRDTLSKLHIFDPVLTTTSFRIWTVKKYKIPPCASWEAYKYKNDKS